MTRASTCAYPAPSELSPLAANARANADQAELPLGTAAFSVPGELDEMLTQVLTYWNGLKRGNAQIPFADDVILGDIWKLSNKVVLVQVLQMPRRFRLDIVGRQLVRMYGEDLAGRLGDELPVRPPLDDFLAQCDATADARTPTFYRHAPGMKGHGGYGRILLPLWADGRVSALLGAVSSW